MKEKTRSKEETIEALHAVAAEMQAALRVLEDAYYSSSVLASEGDSNRT